MNLNVQTQSEAARTVLSVSGEVDVSNADVLRSAIDDRRAGRGGPSRAGCRNCVFAGRSPGQRGPHPRHARRGRGHQRQSLGRFERGRASFRLNPGVCCVQVGGSRAVAVPLYCLGFCVKCACNVHRATKGRRGVRNRWWRARHYFDIWFLDLWS